MEHKPGALLSHRTDPTATTAESDPEGHPPQVHTLSDAGICLNTAEV